MDNSTNKRIAKNTVYLYIRMLATLFIGLYTSRIVLNALGVSDYGLYSLIAGVLSLIAYVNSLMSNSTSRFLTIELGKGESGNLQELFKNCLSLHFIIAIFTILVGETIGLWFVNHELNIAPDRMFAANIVYQFALMSASLTFIQVPFQASIISHEKMNIYAYMSIYDVSAKLLVAFLIYYSKEDRLILYSFMNFIVSTSSVIIYNLYCQQHYKECRFCYGLNKKTTKEIASFIGWNSVESFSWMLNAQGLNILLNKFFSTIVNAARGLTQYISGSITLFITNFQTSARPQIYKYYAQGNMREMNNLIMNTSKFSSYILLIMAIPVILETEFVYKIWLGQVPQYTVPFLRITLIQTFFYAMDTPVIDGIKAVGKLKWIGIISASCYIMFLFFWYILLKMGCNETQIYVIYALQTPTLAIINLTYLSAHTGMKISNFLLKVTLRSCFIFIISFTPAYIVHMGLDEGFIRALVVGIISLISSLSMVFYFGLDKQLRLKIINRVIVWIHH